MYYDVVLDNNYSNGGFDLRIKWIPQDIIGSDKETTGYIVQHICRELDASPKFMKCVSDKNNICKYQHEYYEAWKVENGLIKLESDYGFHDQWKYMERGYYGFLDDIKEKYKTYGTLKMTGIVYWVNQRRPEHAIIQEKFQKKGVIHAGELISTYVFEEIGNLSPVFHREKSGSWNFLNDDAFISAIIDYTKKGRTSHQEWINDIEKYIGSVPVWSKVIDIINTTEL